MPPPHVTFPPAGGRRPSLCCSSAQLHPALPPPPPGEGGPQGRMRGSPIPVSVSPRGTGLPGQGPAFFPKKAGRKKGPGECPRHPQKNGGSWRRCAVRTGQKPGAYRRPFSRRFPYRRCRALGGTHRDCPATPESCCAVPAWPAGPPSVPCLRNTEPVTEVGAPTATQRSGRRGEKEAQRRE